MSSGFRMSIGADRREVARAIAAFADFAEARALPAAARRRMQVVLDELLINTVVHGFADRENGEVTMEVELEPGRLIVTLSDNGRPFDPFVRDAPDTTLSVEERPIGGLGIHLVRQLLDDVDYQRRDDRNVVVLTKRLPGRITGEHHGGR